MKFNYLIPYSDIENLSIDDLLGIIKETKGLKLSSAILENFVFYDDKPILTGNGVYIFKESEKSIYVGSCSARNFIERIPAHFDVRRKGWFNSMLKKEVMIENNIIRKEVTTDQIVDKARIALKNYEVIMINFEEYDKDQILNLEDLLRIGLKPNNGFKRKIFKSTDMNVLDYKRK